MNITDRRGFFKSAAAIPAMATIAAIPSAASAFLAPQPNDPIPEWFEEWKRLRAAYEAVPDDSPEADIRWSLARDKEDQILRTAPTTIEGVSIHLELVTHRDSWISNSLDADDMGIFKNMLSALNNIRGIA